MTDLPFVIQSSRRDPLTFLIAARDDAYGAVSPPPSPKKPLGELAKAEMNLRHVEDTLMERHMKAIAESAVGSWLDERSALILKRTPKVMKNRKASHRLAYEVTFKGKPTAMDFKHDMTALMAGIADGS